jgi:5-methylcytosine-specific restriction enzyme A
MKTKNWHKTIEDKSHIKKEKAKASEIKKSSWWKKKISEGICHYCGRKFEPKDLTMDHIVPVARGGKSTKGNIVPCCFECNQTKGLDTPVDIILSSLGKNKKDN